MTDYDNTNSVSLWFNDKREKPTQPHIKGQGETAIPVWASAWFTKDLNPDDAKALMGIIKRHASNSKAPFLRVAFTPKEDRPQQSNSTAKPANESAANDWSDLEDVPF